MSEAQSIQWFPGHMTKTRRQIEKSLKMVDAVAELIDARIPISSRNPILGELIQKKPRVILMNKSDMADPSATKKWIHFFEGQNIPAIALDCKSGKSLNEFIPLVKKVLAPQISAWQKKGMVGRTIRIMVVGVPNVGKSSLINRLSKSSKSNVEDRPGVTRSNQWFTIGKGFDLLDTPGVLWPKFEDKIVGEHLAFTGAVKDDVLDTEQLASRLLELLVRIYPQELCSRYKLDETDLQKLEGWKILQLVGKKRGMLISGGEIDTERASIMILDEFRSAKIGRITLELPEESK
ncbi:ribosome biogenesis GTPase YlqF [Caproicibacterium sp. BJN0003]|uniref:ribosome biogenesis GTPase YlqF n=1 Tax=Caproicibacterium sp. BJN0003 TaxID=2994078 RepID=UPI0022578216|nr:ribosome biogenesis GTPase YlqF [Caproicibacterium sp. BJN0003]UZT83316.1 ribosome biogenesis GTPase YlqF [Caproicibacterium sp. BJN0003]